MVVESLTSPPRRERTWRPPAIALRPLSGFEEEFIEERREDANTSRLCNEVLARCMVKPGEDAGAALETVRALPVPERDRALILLRRMSLGDEVRTEASCPHCSGASELAFSLSGLPFDFPALPETIETTLLSGSRVVLRFPTAGDQEALLDAPEAPSARRRTRLLARVIVALDDRRGPFDEASVHALDAQTRRDIEAALEHALPDLQLSMNVDCAHCGERFAAPFDVAAFFLPS